MEAWVIIASGPSLTDKQICTVRKAKEEGRVKGVVAVSNVGLDKYPDADVLVAHDGKWWAKYKESEHFRGRKFCRNVRGQGIEQFVPSIPSGCNSGLMAMEVAVKIFKADFLILLGFDMHGTHYFGKHVEGLKNTSDIRFRDFIRQFGRWRGPTVINCTPGSALKKFPFVPIDKVL